MISQKGMSTYLNFKEKNRPYLQTRRILQKIPAHFGATKGNKSALGQIYFLYPF